MVRFDVAQRMKHARPGAGFAGAQLARSSFCNHRVPLHMLKASKTNRPVLRSCVCTTPYTHHRVKRYAAKRDRFPSSNKRIKNSTWNIRKAVVKVQSRGKKKKKLCNRRSGIRAWKWFQTQPTLQGAIIPCCVWLPCALCEVSVYQRLTVAHTRFFITAMKGCLVELSRTGIFISVTL